MSLSKQRYTYVDFTTQQSVPLFAKGTDAIATAADTQENYMWPGGHYFESYQAGANTELQYNAAASGWTIPLDASSADAVEITQGILAGVATPMKFTVGTDAFFIKVTLKQTTLNKVVWLGAGFRELGAYVATASFNDAATAKTAFTEAAGIYANTNAGVLKAHYSINDADSEVTATASPMVTATAITLETYIDSSGVVTHKINGAADTLLTAGATKTITDGTVMIPTISVVRANVAGGSGTELVDYECGLSD